MNLLCFPEKDKKSFICQRSASDISDTTFVYEVYEKEYSDSSAVL